MGVLFYPNMHSIIKRHPTYIPQESKGLSNKSTALWMRKSFFKDKETKLQKSGHESMVVCFDTPPKVEIKNPFPKEIFNPDRTIFLAGTITAEVAKVVAEQIINKSKIATDNPIILWIDSPGGSVEAGLLIRETIKKVEEQGMKVSTLAVGEVSSMAAFLLSAGSKGSRYALEETNIMYHEASYSKGFQAPAEVLEENGWDILQFTEYLFALLAQDTGHSFGTIKKSLSGTDKYFDPIAAVKNGFLDWVIRFRGYHGFARPWGLRMKSYKNWPENEEEKIINTTKKNKTSGKPKIIRLEGTLDAMSSYHIIAKLLSTACINPERDIKLKIFNSPGGLIDEGLGVFDVIRLINVLPNCGSVLTYGRGTIKGISALILSAGKYGQREVNQRAKIILKEIEEVAAAYTPSTELLKIGKEAVRTQKRVIKSFAKHSMPNRYDIEESLRKKRKKKGLIMNALEAVELEFVDKIVA